MSVSLRVGRRCYPIGTAAFLNSFFSTVVARLEAEQRGSRFPRLMRELYSNGELPAAAASDAMEELSFIRVGLERLPPDQLVWDLEDRTLSPPWGSNIAPAITSLGNYFFTSEGKPLLDELASALTASAAAGHPLSIE